MSLTTTTPSTTLPTFVACSIEERHFIGRMRRWMRYRRELAGFVIDVLCVLVSEGATGTLTINLSEGCAACAEFEETTRLSNPT